MKKQKNEKNFKVIFSGGAIYSNSEKALALYNKSRFGELKSGKIIYSIFEALYLLEENKIELLSNNKIITFEELMKKALRRDKKARINYTVFRDMRKRGYIIKTALKFGAEFRVYEKQKKIGEDHATWILYPVSESSKLAWHDFSAKNRVSHSTKKKLLIGIVDDEEDVSYYEVSWIKP